MERGKGATVRGHFALALQDAEFDGGLSVDAGGEGFDGACGDGLVAHEEFGDAAAHGLETEGEGDDVEEEGVGAVSGEDGGLDRGAEGDDEVGVDGGVGLGAEELCDGGADGGDARGAADHDDAVDVGWLDARVAAGLSAAVDGSGDEGREEGFEFGAGDVALDLVVLIEAEADVRGVAIGEFDLGAFGGVAERLSCCGGGQDCAARGIGEVGKEEVDEGLIDVVTAEACVAGGGEDFEECGLVGVCVCVVVCRWRDAENGDVEGSAAEVVDGDGLLFSGAGADAVGEGCGGGLVDDANGFEACESRGVAGGLSLGVVEVSGDGDDGAGDVSVEGLGCAVAECAEDVGGDFGGRDEVVVDSDARGVLGGGGDFVGEEGEVGLDVVDGAAHEAFDGGDGACGVGGGLVAGGLAEGFDGAAVFGEADDAGEKLVVV